MWQCLKRLYYSTCLYFFCFILSAFLIFNVPAILDTAVENGVNKSVQLDSTSADGFAQFEDHNHDGINTYHVYFFNITNPDGILNGELPKLQEVGPFIYNDIRIRSNVSIDTKQNEVTFRQHETTEFLKEETRDASGYESDNVTLTTFNFIFFGSKAGTAQRLWHEAFNGYSDYDRMFETHSVRDLLYGFTDVVAREDRAFPGFMPNLKPSDDPDYTSEHIINAGMQDENNYNYVQWRGQKKVKVSCPWHIGNCPSGEFPCCTIDGKIEHEVWKKHGKFIDPRDPNKVHGSTGDQFKPKTPDTISVWQDLLQRELQLQFQQHVDYKGIECKRYIVDPIEKMNQEEYPRNWAFYQYGRNGLFNMSMVMQGMPLFASYAHFYDSDKNLSSRVIGLNPQQDLHETSLDVEHNSGTTLRERLRFQLSLEIKPETFSFSSDVWFKNLAFSEEGQFVPILWFDQQGETKDSSINDLNKMESTVKAESWVRYIGIALIVISLSLWIYINWQKPTEDPRLNSSQAGLNFFGANGYNGTERLVVEVDDGTTAQSDRKMYQTR